MIAALRRWFGFLALVHGGGRQVLRRRHTSLNHHHLARAAGRLETR